MNTRTASEGGTINKAVADDNSKSNARAPTMTTAGSNCTSMTAGSSVTLEIYEWLRIGMVGQE